MFFCFCFFANKNKDIVKRDEVKPNLHMIAVFESIPVSVVGIVDVANDGYPLQQVAVV